MPDLAWAYDILGRLPLDCLQLRFMQQALFALLLLAPMASVLGVEVISFRMAFFSDAIGHSAFAGVALGLILAVDPHISMPLFGLLVGLGIMAVRRRSSLSSDTVIGIVFSAVVAFGLAVVSRAPGVATASFERGQSSRRNSPSSPSAVSISSSTSPASAAVKLRPSRVRMAFGRKV